MGSIKRDDSGEKLLEVVRFAVAGCLGTLVDGPASVMTFVTS